MPKPKIEEKYLKVIARSSRYQEAIGVTNVAVFTYLTGTFTVYEFTGKFMTGVVCGAILAIMVIVALVYILPMLMFPKETNAKKVR